MKVMLIVVPPSCGERDYSLDFNLPAVPREGEYVTLARDDDLADPKPNTEDDTLEIYECFFVRHVWWDLRYPSSAPFGRTGDIGSPHMIAVEVETAWGPHITAAHRRSCEAYEAKGLSVRAFGNSAY